MPTLFDEIVLRRPKVGNKPDMRPLWRLKLSDSEFEELRSFLLTGVKLKYPDWFCQYPRECLLFFAEYWKRFFNGGPHSVQDVLDCLTSGLDNDYRSAFYRAARNGAGLLRIEIYEGGDRHRRLDSILYQGGLPMRLICQSDREGFQNWTAFAKKLVRGYIDLSDDKLGLGQVATNLQSIRQFADQLYLGVATNDPKAMPFDCPDENHPWYKELMRLKESERRKSQESNPFSIDWVMELDDRKERGRILGRVRIPSKLPETFIQEQAAADADYSTVRVLADGIVRASVDYQRGYARMSRDILLPLPASDTTLSVDYEDCLVATGSFDFSRPHLFSFNGRQSNGLLRAEKSNRIKESEMMLFIPEIWTLETDRELESSNYVFSDISVSIVRVPEGYSKDLRLKDPDGNTIVFNGIPIGETQLLYTPLYSELVLSPSLCDASELQRCHILTETQDGTLRQPRPIEFEGSEKGHWNSSPALGRIRARAVGIDKEISEPVTLCNVGKDFHIDVVEADSNQASIRISWPQGQVTCIEKDAVFSSEKNTWTVKKEDLIDPMAVRFRLVAKGNSSSSAAFLLKLRAPFRQIQITDEFGLPVMGRIHVPMCDYEKFSYNIFGYNSVKIKVGTDVYKLNSLGKMLLFGSGNELTKTSTKRIQRHGSIAALFGSSGKIHRLLKNKEGTIATSDVEVSLKTSEGSGQTIRLNIREYPFRIYWNQEANIFILKDPDKEERAFRHSLLAFRLKNPTLPPISITPNEEGELKMPDELLEEEDILIAGKAPGRMLPKRFNKSEKDHSEILELKKREIIDAIIGDEIWEDSLNWFGQAAHYGLPFSSLLQLQAISLHQETLMLFAFQCMLKFSSEENEDLIERLLQFSRDLDFKWFWLIPIYQKGLFRIIEPKLDIENEAFVRMMMPPGIATLPMEYLQQIAYGMIPNLMTQFDGFIRELIKRSFEDNTYQNLPKDMYETACGWINNDGRYSGKMLVSKYDWFPDFSFYLKPPIEEYEQYKEENRTESENWLISRVKAFTDHMSEGKTDLFSMSTDARRNTHARRSMCLCYEVAPYLFIREAHNEMLR